MRTEYIIWEMELLAKELSGRRLSDIQRMEVERVIMRLDRILKEQNDAKAA